MASESPKPVPTSTPSPSRLWAEQLAMGMSLFMGILIFMAIFHPKKLSVGVEVLGPNDIAAYGWMSVLGRIGVAGGIRTHRRCAVGRPDPSSRNGIRCGEACGPNADTTVVRAFRHAFPVVPPADGLSAD